jgi:phosphocarrier protein
LKPTERFRLEKIELYVKKSNQCTETGLLRTVTIENILGLHARAAARIAKVAEGARGGVVIEKEGERADATSILDILMLNCPMGSTVTIQVDTPEDIDILESIERLIKKKLGES